jgi:CDP-diacylglycerol--glycerol-3-phosphate 3-phosphatidyltransferase
LSEHAIEKKKPSSLTDWLRLHFKGVLDPVAGFLNRIGLFPNTVTIIGLVGNAVAAFFLARGQLLIGGIIVLAMGPIDALDGSMARLRGEPTEFGAFVDSVTDRYSELVIFLGLLILFLQRGDTLATVLVYMAAAGSVLVSYVRARGQSVGAETKVGLLSRLERYLVIVPSLIFNIPEIGLGIIAVFANVTAIQRILDVRRQFRQKNKNS